MPDPDLSLRIAQLAGDADRRSTVAHRVAGEALALARSVQAALANTGKLLAQVVRPNLVNLNAAEREHLRVEARQEAGQQALLAELAALADEVRGTGAGEALRLRVLTARREADEAVLAELAQLEARATDMTVAELAEGKLLEPPADTDTDTDGNDPAN